MCQRGTFPGAAGTLFARQGMPASDPGLGEEMPFELREASVERHNLKPRAWLLFLIFETRYSSLASGILTSLGLGSLAGKLLQKHAL